MNRFLQILFFLALGSLHLIGQNNNSVENTIIFSIPELARVDFQGSSRVTTADSPSATNNAVEQTVTASTNDNTWLNYSSIVSPGASNYISVFISEGELPPATIMALTIGEDMSAGGGSIGNPTREIILSRYPQNIITGIGSCYTGRGINKGHQLFFSLIGENANLAIPGNNDYSISVTYTITSTD